MKKLSTDMMKQWRSLKAKWNKKDRTLAQLGSKLGGTHGFRLYSETNRNNKSNSRNKKGTSNERYDGGKIREAIGQLNQPKDDNNTGTI